MWVINSVVGFQHCNAFGLSHKERNCVLNYGQDDLCFCFKLSQAKVRLYKAGRMMQYDVWRQTWTVALCCCSVLYNEVQS